MMWCRVILLISVIVVCILSIMIGNLFGRKDNGNNYMFYMTDNHLGWMIVATILQAAIVIIAYTNT